MMTIDTFLFALLAGLSAYWISWVSNPIDRNAEKVKMIKRSAQLFLVFYGLVFLVCVYTMLDAVELNWTKVYSTVLSHVLFIWTAWKLIEYCNDPQVNDTTRRTILILLYATLAMHVFTVFVQFFEVPLFRYIPMGSLFNLLQKGRKRQPTRTFTMASRIR
jgi:hypothetical protein